MNTKFFLYEPAFPSKYVRYTQKINNDKKINQYSLDAVKDRSIEWMKGWEHLPMNFTITQNKKESEGDILRYSLGYIMRDGS